MELEERDASLLVRTPS